jgi:hypothetical protein
MAGAEHFPADGYANVHKQHVLAMRWTTEADDVHL